jgi:mannose-6-phosphate isomerase-like protein (cupin superfamily)
MLRTLTNPVNGDTMLVLESTTDTSGERLRFQFTLPPHAEGTPLHYHSALTETFTVVEGTLAMCVGGKNRERMLVPGETAAVPVGVSHRFWNPSGRPVTFISR